MWYLFRNSLTIQFAIVSSMYGSSWHDSYTRGRVQFDHGLYREAIAEYEGALPLAESPRDRGATLYCLALAHGRVAELANAEQLYKESLGIFRSERDNAELAVSLAGLGEIYRAQRRPDDALATERHALTILKGLGMGETQQAADVLTITGEVLTDQRRFKAAEQDLRAALAILEKTVGPDQPAFAMSLNNLGVIAFERRHAAQAEALFKRALSVRQASLGPEHPLIAVTLLSLSAVYLDQKRYAEAEATCRRSFEMMRRFVPANHPDLIKARIELALIAHQSGNKAAAIGILEDSVQSVDAQPLAISGEYFAMLNLYSRYLSDAGQKEKSRQVRLEARELWEKSGRASAGGSTVTLAELEAGRGGFL